MNSNPAAILILALGVCGIAAVLITAVRIRAGSRRGNVSARSLDRRSADATRRDIEDIMTELEGLARQVHARIDQQLARIEAATRKCDERIDRLDRLTRAAEGEPAFDVTVSDSPERAEEPRLAPPAPGKPDVVPAAGPDSKSAIYRMADTGLSPMDIATRTGRTTGEVELILSLRKTIEQALHA